MARSFTALVCSLAILAGSGTALAASDKTAEAARPAATTEAPARLAATAKKVPMKSELADYAAREKKGGEELANFRGGHAGYIAIPVGTVILLTVLLIILL